VIHQDISECYAAYRKSSQGHYLEVNDDLLKAAGVDSINDIIGLKDADLPWHQMAASYSKNDQLVYRTRQTHVFYEPCLYMGRPQIYRATKTPIIGPTGKIIGIYGISIPITDRCLIPLTKQQTACLRQLALGKTHKQIANELGLAQKTVEHYLEAIKIKLNCKTRSELILQAIERGLVSFL